MTIYTTTTPTPVGTLRITVDERGTLLRIELPAHEGKDKGRSTKARADEVEDGTRCAHVIRQLDEYFAGRRTAFDLQLGSEGPEFQRKAWSALEKIPFGKTRSYQEQAQKIGKPTAMRAVGAANGRNPIPIVVPCHRVIGKDGSLTGFGGGIDCKQWLLEHEQRVLTSKRAK